MGLKRTAPSVFAMKASGEKVACITAYDSTSASIAQSADPDLILVGDSVGNVMLGYATTLFVDLEDMIRFTRAAASVVQDALLVADLPFGSYQSSVAQAVDSSVALMKAGAEAVKLEGSYVDAVEAIVHAGIPVMGHVGMTPQSYHRFGGHRVQGKSDPNSVIDDAIALDQIGVFSMVLELVPHELAGKITSQVHCPTIGIGAGMDCDGQIQVFHDVVGLSRQRFKHAWRYAEGAQVFDSAVARYVDGVRRSEHPPTAKDE